MNFRRRVGVHSGQDADHRCARESKITAQALAQVQRKKATFHGEWHDTILPTTATT